jgi:undecaprenyl diphosphate synthase
MRLNFNTKLYSSNHILEDNQMHVGIIMDGNRRWAEKHMLQFGFGHKKGKENLLKILELCPEKNIDVLTVYALSTENLQSRSQLETKLLISLIEDTLAVDSKLLKTLGCRASFLGDIDNLPRNISEKLKEIEDSSLSYESTFLLQVCLNYGGRDEIVRAVNRVVSQGQSVTEQSISDNLDSSLQPDLIIRTGGEKRMSNFLMWQSTYSELYFTYTLWPDFEQKELQKALDYYHQTKRNFGK